MKFVITYISIILFPLLFQGCSSPDLKTSHFIGTWEADDGAIIEFYNNGKCKVSKLNYYKIYPFEKFKNQLLSFDGTWNITTQGGLPQLHLSYNEGKSYEYKGEMKEYKAGFDLEILGEGVFGDKLPLHLYKIIGDPDDIDESNKYKFVKQK